MGPLPIVLSLLLILSRTSGAEADEKTIYEAARNSAELCKHACADQVADDIILKVGDDKYCERGCRFQSMAQIVKARDGTDILVACHKACLKAYNGVNELGAMSGCSRGCHVNIDIPKKGEKEEQPKTKEVVKAALLTPAVAVAQDEPHPMLIHLSALPVEGASGVSAEMKGPFRAMEEVFPIMKKMEEKAMEMHREFLKSTKNQMESLPSSSSVFDALYGGLPYPSWEKKRQPLPKSQSMRIQEQVSDGSRVVLISNGEQSVKIVEEMLGGGEKSGEEKTAEEMASSFFSALLGGGAGKRVEPPLPRGERIDTDWSPLFPDHGVSPAFRDEEMAHQYQTGWTDCAFFRTGLAQPILAMAVLIGLLVAVYHIMSWMVPVSSPNQSYSGVGGGDSLIIGDDFFGPVMDKEGMAKLTLWESEMVKGGGLPAVPLIHSPTPEKGEAPPPYPVV